MTRRQFLKNLAVGTTVITAGVQLSLLDKFLNLFKKKKKVEVQKLPEPDFLIGNKSNSFLDAGYVYAPYVPLLVTPTIFSADDYFSPIKGVSARNGNKILINPNFYTVGEIHV